MGEERNWPHVATRLTETWQTVKAHYPVIATAPTSHVGLKYLSLIKCDAVGITWILGLLF